MTQVKTIRLWKRAPFIRLLPPLVLGILTEYFFRPDFTFSVSLLVFSFIAIVVFERIRSEKKFELRRWSGTPYVILIFLLGMVLMRLGDIRNSTEWYGHHIKEAEGLQIIVRSSPEKRTGTFKISARIKAVVTGDEVVSTKGNALFYFPVDSAVSQLKPGDVLVVKNRLTRVTNSGNPGSFDYEKFLAHQNIFHQAYITKKEWTNTGENRLSVLGRTIQVSLGYSHSVFERYLTGHREIALAKALLTGDRSELDRNLVQAYSNTGVVHIMAISGLHLGLIYIFLFRLSEILPGVRKNKKAQVGIILFGIWFFALMTGGSPSVLRSAVMFSFLSFGILKNRRISSFNFWGAAAFLLLCLNPLLLFHVGFQLSFLAVLGILAVQKQIYRWFDFRNKGVDYLWQLISVTLSAQLFTLPLCLYYFHQFPVLFIVSNLLAIPLASIGLWSGMTLLIVGWIPIAASWVGWFMNLKFKGLNGFIGYMNSFSFVVWKGFSLNVPETILLSLLIIFILSWLMNKSTLSHRYALLCMAGIFVSTIIRYAGTQSQKVVVVYNIPYVTAIDFISSDSVSGVIYDSRKEAGPVSFSAILNCREYLNVTKPGEPVKVEPLGENELFVGPKTILHIKGAQDFSQLNEKIKVDAIVLSGTPRVKIADLNRTFDAGVYIFTPANKRYQIDKWKKDCEELLLHSHDIRYEGAWVMNY